MFTAGNPSFLVWCPQALVLQGFVLLMGLQHVLLSSSPLLLTCLSSNALPASQNALTFLSYFLLYFSFSSIYSFHILYLFEHLYLNIVHPLKYVIL